MKDAAFSSARLLRLYDRISDADDAIPRLRRFVLDLAVRGKLVEQDAGDETAAELLKRIAKEKARLVKAGEIPPAKAFDLPTANDLAFPVPRHWHPVFVATILNELQTGPFGSSLHQSDYRLGGIPVINPASLQNEQIVPIDKMAVDEKTLERLASFKLRSGDIVMARRGEMGRCAIVTETEAGWLCGTGSLILRPSALIYAQFLVLVIGSPFGREYLGNSSVGATMQNLNQAILLNLAFGLPPLAEQHRIVAKVDELMALCDRLQQARAGREALRDRLTTASLTRLTAPETGTDATYETFQSHARFALQSLPTLTTRSAQIKALRQTILNLAVRGRLTFDDVTAIGEPLSSKAVENEAKPYPIHPSWKWVRMDEVVDFRGGSQPPKSTFIYKPREGYTRLVQIRDFKSDANLTFVPTARANRPFLETDVMIGRYGPPVFQILRGLAGTYNVALMKAVPEERLLSRDFMFYVLQESRIHDEVVRESERTAGQTGVRLPLLNAFVVGLPPIAEQHRIVAKVDALMTLCDQLESGLTTTTTTRSRLLEALLHEALAPAMEAA